MRLIDADEVKNFFETRFPELDDGVHWSRNDIIQNLDNIETVKIVESIPIEWIKKWLKSKEVYIYNEKIYSNVNVLDLLKDWEKEGDNYER